MKNTNNCECVEIKLSSPGKIRLWAKNELKRYKKSPTVELEYLRKSIKIAASRNKKLRGRIRAIEILIENNNIC